MMKPILPILILFASPAFASDECGSVWLFQPFKVCATGANGLDLSRPTGDTSKMNLKSAWVGGGKDQHQVCLNVAEGFNNQNAANGLHAELGAPTPIAEETENKIIQQEYRYTCDLTIQKFAFKEKPNPACGSEEQLSYKVGGSSRDLPGSNITCLSCDNYSDQPPANMVKCLHDNIQNIVETKSIEIRDSDLAAVSAQVKRVINLSRQVPIENLRTTDQLSFFTDFLDKYPVQNEAPRGGGGLGTRPTLQ